MRKKDELTIEDSCINKAKDDEMIFVLRGKDPQAPGLILEWCARRVKDGQNKVADGKIQEALQCARIMEIERERYK